MPFGFCDLELKLDQGEKGRFKGYLVAYGNQDRGGDVCVKGCADESIRALMSADQVPNGLWMHKMEEPALDWIDFKSDDKGLLAEGQCWMDDEIGRRAYRTLLSKTGRGLSPGYKCASKDKEYRKSDSATLLHKIDIVEGSIVTRPMNPNASIVSVKSFAKELQSGKFKPERSTAESASTPEDHMSGAMYHQKQAKRSLKAGDHENAAKHLSAAQKHVVAAGNTKDETSAAAQAATQGCDHKASKEELTMKGLNIKADALPTTAAGGKHTVTSASGTVHEMPTADDFQWNAPGAHARAVAFHAVAAKGTKGDDKAAHEAAMESHAAAMQSPTNMSKTLDAITASKAALANHGQQLKADDVGMLSETWKTLVVNGLSRKTTVDDTEARMLRDALTKK